MTILYYSLNPFVIVVLFVSVEFLLLISWFLYNDLVSPVFCLQGFNKMILTAVLEKSLPDSTKAVSYLQIILIPEQSIIFVFFYKKNNSLKVETLYHIVTKCYLVSMKSYGKITNKIRNVLLKERNKFPSISPRLYY